MKSGPAAGEGGNPNGATLPPHNFGTLKMYHLFPLKRNYVTAPVACARKLLETPSLSQARREKMSIFPFSLFYKQNALIYSRNFFSMQQKCTHVSPEKLTCTPPP